MYTFGQVIECSWRNVRELSSVTLIGYTNEGLCLNMCSNIVNNRDSNWSNSIHGLREVDSSNLSITHYRIRGVSVESIEMYDFRTLKYSMFNLRSFIDLSFLLIISSLSITVIGCLALSKYPADLIIKAESSLQEVDMLLMSQIGCKLTSWKKFFNLENI